MIADIALPTLRGRLQLDVALGPTMWFRVGGAAEYLVKPLDTVDLQNFLRDLPHEIPVTVIGAGSNLIIRDGGIAGAVIKLGRGFNDITVEDNAIIAGGAALDMTLAEHAAAAARTGLEFLSGIPGTVGGAVAMNAGAYGSDVSQVLDWAEIVTRSGELLRLALKDLALGYRRSQIPPGAVVTRARFLTQPGNLKIIAARMQEIKTSRESTQPVRARTGGSTFANPTDMKAWELIDAAGCRGLRKGGAQVSELHCNFLINTGDATAADLEALGEEVRRRVRDTSGIDLHWEIKRIGVPA
jgi:UDP-N-acetylmuramate dehydrogenase